MHIMFVTCYNFAKPFFPQNLAKTRTMVPFYTLPSTLKIHNKHIYVL